MGISTIAAVWLGLGLIVFVAIHWLGRNEPTDHGQIIIGQTALIGCFFWPLFLIALPFCLLFALLAWLFGKQGDNHDHR